MNPTSAKPGFTLSNGVVLLADVGKIGGELVIFCCSTDITIEQSATSEEIVCDVTQGLADRLDYNPRAVVTFRELNFNRTVLERALNLAASINSVGWRTMGKGDNPATTPTALSEVDGPHSLTWVDDLDAPTGDGDEAIITLNNTLIIEGQVHAWSRGPAGNFVEITIGVTWNWDSDHTNLATGEVHVTYTGAKAGFAYFTYTYQPMTIGAVELFNPWTLSQTDVWLRVIHEHAQGEKLIIWDFWRARARPSQTTKIKSGSGDRVVPTELVFDVFADFRYHPESGLYAITEDVIGRTITPEYGCDGAAWATPLVT